MLKMAAILKSKMAARGTNEKNCNNLICIPGSLLHHLRPKNQIVHEPPTNNISNQTTCDSTPSNDADVGNNHLKLGKQMCSKTKICQILFGGLR